MFKDKGLMYEDKLALSGLSVATADSTNVLDFSADGDAGTPMALMINVDTAAGSTGSGTLQISLLNDSAVGFGSATTHVLTGTLAATALTAGAVLYKQRLPIGWKRYSKLAITVGTAVFQSGKISAFLVPDVQTNR